jgi:tripeptide aminopeptidase
VDVKAVESHLMRFLSVDGVTRDEAAIGAAVSDGLRKISVPASAIRFNDVDKRIKLPTETGNLLVDLLAPDPVPACLCCPSRHRAALRRCKAET